MRETLDSLDALLRAMAAEATVEALDGGDLDAYRREHGEAGPALLAGHYWEARYAQEWAEALARLPEGMRGALAAFQEGAAERFQRLVASGELEAQGRDQSDADFVVFDGERELALRQPEAPRELEVPEGMSPEEALLRSIFGEL